MRGKVPLNCLTYTNPRQKYEVRKVFLSLTSLPLVSCYPSKVWLAFSPPTSVQASGCGVMKPQKAGGSCDAHLPKVPCPALAAQVGCRIAVRKGGIGVDLPSHSSSQELTIPVTLRFMEAMAKIE